MIGRWCSWFWLGFLGCCTVVACASLALTAVARYSELPERWLVGAGAGSIPRAGYTDMGVAQAGFSISIPFGGALKTKQWQALETGAQIRCASQTLRDDVYVCDRHTVVLSAPFPVVTAVSAIFPLFAFLNGPVTRFLRRRAGRCPRCGRAPDDARPACPACAEAQS